MEAILVSMRCIAAQIHLVGVIVLEDVIWFTIGLGESMNSWSAKVVSEGAEEVSNGM